MSHFHAVAWIDQSEARIFHFSAEAAEKLVLHAHHKGGQHKSHSDGVDHEGEVEAQKYFHSIAEALATSGEILITGPGGAKTALLKHLARHDPSTMQRVVGVESSDHPTDGQVLDHARHYFAGADHKTSQKV